MLRFFTSGESHGQALMAILDGVPAGIPIDIALIDKELWRRQQGYGRSARQKIENDKAEIIGGIRHGITTGAPVGILIKNKDWQNWQNVMSIEALSSLSKEAAEEIESKSIKCFRPGHADLAGTIKFRQNDIRDVLERASARETAARVAVGAICQQILAYFDIKMASHVTQVGNINAKSIDNDLDLETLDHLVLQSELFCADQNIEQSMKELIKATWQEGDSLGGTVEVLVDGLPIGLGSYTQWDERLDGQLAQALMSVQAIKAVEIADAIENAASYGSQVHDPILSDNGNSKLPFKRSSNHAGGLEGGMTNGERLKIKAYMKPIPTLRKGLPSVTFPEFKNDIAHFERSDVCAISAASVVCKSMVAFILARAFISKFGGDTASDMQFVYKQYLNYCQNIAKTPVESK